MAKLTRHFGFLTLLIYGIGDILGAGIYALVGKVAGTSGTYSWMSFSVALLIATLTALGYAELCARLPKSGGVSYFAQTAFNNKWIAFFAGWTLTCTCLFSIATLSVAFTGYLKDFNLDIPKFITISIFLLILGFINFRGIKQSSWANIIATTVELAGLVIVMYAAFSFLGEKSASAVPSSEFSINSIIQGAALAFFAFIGFEDLANVAEEVKDPRKNLPRAIITAVAVTGVFYVLIAWLSTQVVDPTRLSQSKGSLAEVVAASGFEHLVIYFSVIALFAVSNTCLLNSITASRLLFGMSEQKLLPSFLSKIHERFHTPYIATLIVIVVAYGITFIGNLKELASVTSLLVLIVFSITNISLIKIKTEKEKWDAFRVPMAIPVLAVISNVTLLFFVPLQSIYTLIAVLLIGFILKKFLLK